MIMKTLCIAAIAASLLATSITEASAADPCEPPGAEAAEFWARWAKVVTAAGCAVAKVKSGQSFSFPACLEKREAYEAALTEMMKTAHQGKDDSSRYGPRHVRFGDSQRGRVVDGDGPIFRTGAPLRTDHLDVTLSPTEGEGKVEVLLCKESQDGKRSKLGQFVMEYGKGKTGGIVSKHFKDVKNHVVRMRVRGASKATNAEFTVLFEGRAVAPK